MRLNLTVVAALAAACALAAPVSASAAGKAALSTSVQRLNCGSQALDAGAKPCGSVTFTNTSSRTVQLTSTAIVENGAVDFAEGSSTCTAVSFLSPGQSCVIEVLFNPGTAGRRAAKLVQREGTLGTEASVRLIGTGTI